MLVDLRSDTVTKPSPGMREAIAKAEVGDDVYGEDPTVNKLEKFSAELLGKEAGLFVPTGTMANLVSFLTLTKPGDAVILAEQSHTIHYEVGGLVRIAQVLPLTVPGELGKLTEEDIILRYNSGADVHRVPVTMVSIENTVNRGGGVFYNYEEICSISRVCKRLNLKLHCDGARIFNASIACNVDVKYLAEPCDIISFCLSKGLGAPAGSVVCGSKELIDRARKFRKLLGGGMRQAGVLASAGLYALTHHIDDLRKDHERASIFRWTLENKGWKFPLPSPTNIVFISVSNAYELKEKLKGKGILVNAVSNDRIRVVFHRDITDEQFDYTLKTFLNIAL
ncbi:MAG: low specificity L-threonine aldolase [Candidatus Hydrogenedentes bacterium]|nr:low specificity L-threonine aldolase [Candidatus Hydrogenedentota bacterium]